MCSRVLPRSLSSCTTPPLLSITCLAEEEEEENEHADLTPGQIKLKAFGILALGVLAVTLFRCAGELLWLTPEA